VTVRVDGVPFTICSVAPAPDGRLRCPNIPHTAKTLELRFSQGIDLAYALDFQDDECWAAHPVCPK
jgi:hypothetical protein